MKKCPPHITSGWYSNQEFFLLHHWSRTTNHSSHITKLVVTPRIFSVASLGSHTSLKVSTHTQNVLLVSMLHWEWFIYICIVIIQCSCANSKSFCYSIHLNNTGLTKCKQVPLLQHPSSHIVILKIMFTYK